jgi:hypothetical protein
MHPLGDAILRREPRATQGCALVRRLLSSLGAFLLCGLFCSACAAGELGLSGVGSGGATDDAATAPEAGAGDDSGSATTPGPTTDSGGRDGAPAGPTAMDSSTSSTSGDAAPADAADDAPDAPTSCGSPGGTYTGTCQDCSVVGTTLTCLCKTDSGSSAESSLDLCTCPVLTEISNTNGVLSCCGIPGGSYTSTCTSCSMTETTLACTCTTSSGATASTSLDLCTCTQASQIGNTNGQLTCP